MAILKSTQIKGDLTVTGSLNVQGNLTYVGVENLRVKDHQIELNANDKGSASLAGADQAGIVIRGAKNTTVNPSSEEASILYNHADDTLVVNKTIKGTVSNATSAASADKVAQKLTVNVTDETGSLKTVEFDGSEVKTVDVNLKGLQDQINSLTGGAGSIATQINDAISKLNSNVTAEADGTAAKDGVFVLQSVRIDESAGKLTSATPTAVEVEQAGAAAAAKIALIGTDDDTADSATIKGAKKYADSLASHYAAASHTHKIADVEGLQNELDGKAAKTHTHAIADVTGLSGELAKKQDNLTETQLAAVNSGVTAERLSGYDTHVANTAIHVTTTDKEKWNAAEANAKTYTDTKIKDLGLGTAAQKNVFTGTIADSTSDDLVTAAQVKAYAAGVVGAMHFRGAVADTGSVANPASGDICLVGTKEYVYSDGKWVLFGDESAYDTKGSAAAVLGKEGDDFTATTVYGVKAYAKKYADDLAAGKANTVHSHEISDVNGLQGKLDEKAAADHNHDKVYSKLGHKHVVADITDLQGELDKKQNNLNTDQLNAVNSGITATKVGNYDKHVDNADIHVTAEQKTAWTAKQDALANADILAAITSTQVSNWDAAATKAHVHGNKTVLDGITSEKVAAWDGAKSYADTVVNTLSGSVATTDAAQDTKISNIESSITDIQNNYVKKAGDTMTGNLTMPSNGANGIVFGDMKIVWNSKDSAIEFVPTTTA